MGIERGAVVAASASGVASGNKIRTRQIGKIERFDNREEGKENDHNLLTRWCCHSTHEKVTPPSARPDLLFLGRIAQTRRPTTKRERSREENTSSSDLLLSIKLANEQTRE